MVQHMFWNASCCNHSRHACPASAAPDVMLAAPDGMLAPFKLQTAVSVDGKVRATLYPRTKDPQYGWWTEASGAPPNAPFNEPFYLIL